jgi:signal peptidase II
MDGAARSLLPSMDPTAPPGRRRPRLLHVAALAGLVAGLVGCDHATKHLAVSRLDGRPAVTLVGGVLDLTYVENRDSAFNLSRVVPARQRRPFLLGGGVVVIALILGFWWRGRRGRWPVQVAFALVLAGGLGNLLDRAFRGYVVDFVHLHHWPVFNAADAYLVAGAALLFLAARRRTPPTDPVTG